MILDNNLTFIEIWVDFNFFPFWHLSEYWMAKIFPIHCVSKFKKYSEVCWASFILWGHSCLNLIKIYWGVFVKKCEDSISLNWYGDDINGHLGHWLIFHFYSTFLSPQSQYMLPCS